MKSTSGELLRIDASRSPFSPLQMLRTVLADAPPSEAAAAELAFGEGKMGAVRVSSLELGFGGFAPDHRFQVFG